MFQKLFQDIQQKDSDQLFVQSKNKKRSGGLSHGGSGSSGSSGSSGASTAEQVSDSSTVAVTMQILEVYNEIVYDLAVPPVINNDGTYTRKQVDIKQNGRTGRTHVPEAVSVPAHTCADATEVLRCGLAHRRSASHAMNVQSSRSHVVVHVKCVAKRSDGTRAFGQLFLVDLAGSEQVKKSEGTAVFRCFFGFCSFRVDCSSHFIFCFFSCTQLLDII